MSYPKEILYKIGDVLDHYESIKDTSGKTVAIAATLAALDALMEEYEDDEECCVAEARACNHTCCRDD
jgi:anaerobic glycerol-3-phosphate dehydrogenase